jgi:hypothetical protein
MDISTEIKEMFSEYENTNEVCRFKQANKNEELAISEFFKIGVRVEEPNGSWQHDWRNARLKRDEHCARLEMTKKQFVFGY